MNAVGNRASSKVNRGSGCADRDDRKDIQKTEDRERWLQLMRSLMNMNRRGLT